MDLRQVDPTWIDSITLDAADASATVKLDVPVDGGGTVAEYEEIVDLTSTKTSPELRRLAKEFVEALTQHIAQRVGVEGSAERCVTCPAGCCGRVFSEVHVKASDLEVLGPTQVAHGVELYDVPQWTGYVGQLRRIPWSGEGEERYEDDERAMACVFLDPSTSLCKIYDRRPEVCRDYTAQDCDHHEQGSQKLIRLRRKAMQS